MQTKRGRVGSLDAMDLVFPMRFANTDVGDRIHVVSYLRCLDPDHEAHLFQSIPDDVMFHVSGLIEGNGDVYTFLNASMVKSFPKPVLMVDSDTRILQHSQPSWTTMCEVIELCSGFGGMSQGYAACGFSPVLAVDFNEKMTSLYRKQCEVTTLNADVSKAESIAKIWHLSKGASTIVAGYACQPFSMLGDRLGEFDARAMSLRGVLAIAFYTRAQAIVLECVIPASKNNWVKSEIQKFVDATGFHLSQSELHLSDIWPSRRSRAWWILTAPWLGPVPLPAWPKLATVQKVNQVIPRILAWAPEDEAKLVLNAMERLAFGVDDNTCAKYLLNMEGCAPCALHSWGSQMLPCECGCRASGLSLKRLEEKGLFGLLVRSASDAFSHECRHIHPNECLALQGFDPTIDFGENPRLTLSAAGQMASPFQALWVFSCLAERMSMLRQGSVPFGPLAQLQAYQSWVLMRCRRVWPCDFEPVADPKMQSLMQFWEEKADLSIHELMHPPRWPQLEESQVNIASVLDLLIRSSMQCLPGQCISNDVLPIPDEIEDDLHDATPWVDIPPDMPRLPEPRSDACIVVLFHEFADPISLVATPGCTIYDFVQAHAKLVGSLQITTISNFHGVEVHPSQTLEPGMVICIRCEDSPATESSQGFGDVPSTAIDSAGENSRPKECESNASMGGAPAHHSMQALEQPVDPKACASHVGPISHCAPALNQKVCDEGFQHLIPPTAPWTQPIHEGIDAQAMPSDCGLGQKRYDHAALATNSSWISAAPLLGLKGEQFLHLRVPAVVNMNHLDSLHSQILIADDRLKILEQQVSIWSDDEVRFHMHSLAHSYAQFQLCNGNKCPTSCFVLDPLLATGWLHHGLHECATWGTEHQVLKQQQQMIITACMVNSHWIPVVMSAQGPNLRVCTWDLPGHDHEKLNQMCAVLAKAMGFDDVVVDRHHRMFLSSDRCGALAIAFLSYSLLQTMLPTTSEETEVIHSRLKLSFANEVMKHQTTVRPWVWGAGDTQPVNLTAEACAVPDVAQNIHTCIDAERRLDLMRTHGMELGDDEIRFHITYMLDHKDCILNREDSDVPGFVFLDPLALNDWKQTGQEKCVQWCEMNPHVIGTGHNIVTALLVNHHWVPMWIEPRNRYFLVHLLHDQITRVDEFIPLLDVLCAQFGLPEYVLHWTPQLVQDHRMCGAAAMAFLAHVLVRADMPSDLLTLRYMQANMRSSFVAAVLRDQCCRCPMAWGAGPNSICLQEYEPEFSRGGFRCVFGNIMEIDLCRLVAKSFDTNEPLFWDEAAPKTLTSRHEKLTNRTDLDCSSHERAVLDRLQIWTDAEMVFHLERVVDSVFGTLDRQPDGCEWGFFPPFANKDLPEVTDRMCTRLATAPFVGLISTMLVNDHWIPLVICCRPENLDVSTWDHARNTVAPVHDFAACLGGKLGIEHALTYHERFFMAPNMCGALAIAFLYHRMLGCSLPTNLSELAQLNAEMKADFAHFLSRNGRTHEWTLNGLGDVEDEPSHDARASATRSHTCISADQRLNLLRNHGQEWGDDEIRFHLESLRSHPNHQAHLRHCNIPGICVLEPLTMQTWPTIGPAMCEFWCRTHAREIANGCHIVSVLLVQNH